MPIEHKNRGRILHTSTEYGKSVKDSPLEVYLPQNDSNINILVMAGIHGDEPEGTVLLSEALRSVTPNELKNAVIICANPDGLTNGTRANANGVDLNRNFPATNWQTDPVYYRNSKEEKRDIELSPGVKPGSEPETESLIKIIGKLNPKYLISIHAPLACVEDPKESVLSKWISENINLPLVKDISYKTPGSMGSWAADQDIDIITFELSSSSLEEMRKIFVPVLIEILANKCNY